jgi:membrane protein implicated in regulation of membrane protease activity
MVFFRILVFVVCAIIACVLLPLLAVQYPVVFLVVVAIGVYLFSRSFSNRKKYQ